MNTSEEHLNITIDENEIIAGAKDIIRRIRPSWPFQQLHFKVMIQNQIVSLILLAFKKHIIWLFIAFFYKSV